MPNGRPGDHPYTDIVRHGIDVYTEAVSELVRAVDEYDDSGARKRASSLLWNVGQEPSGEEVEQLTADLRALREEIEAAGDYRAASPLAACLDDEDGVYTASVRELVRDVDEQIERLRPDVQIPGRPNGSRWQPRRAHASSRRQTSSVATRESRADASACTSSTSRSKVGG